MKKLIYILTIVIAITSCKKETLIDYVIVKGKITNPIGNKIIISKSEKAYFNYRPAKTFTDTIVIANDGNFVDTLKITTGFYAFYDSKNFKEIYLKTGDEITFNFDANNFYNTLVFSGKGSEINNYFALKEEKENELLGDNRELFTLNEQSFKSKIKEAKTIVSDMLTSSVGIDEIFKAKENNNINYSYLSRLNRYKENHSYLTENPDFEVSKDFLNELNNVDYNNEEDFLFSDDYKNLIYEYYSKQSKKLIKKDTLLSRDIAMLNTLASISNETIKNGLLATEIDNLNYTNDQKDFYDLFMAVSTNEENKSSITKIYNKISKLEKGRPSPKFVNYENYAGATASLDDFKGKYVYIDVWATWCVPCIAEIPFLKEVEKKYHNKNIEFISLSVDVVEDREKWKTMIKEKELGGVQLLADNNFNSQFIKDYLINAIPRFILIDPDGNIISYNAERPSDPKLIDLFDKYNI